MIVYIYIKKYSNLHFKQFNIFFLSQDVEADVTNGEEDCMYFEQLNFNHYVYKLGDCVYLRSDQEKPFIARIDKMWKDSK